MMASYLIGVRRNQHVSVTELGSLASISLALPDTISCKCSFLPDAETLPRFTGASVCVSSRRGFCDSETGICPTKEGTTISVANAV